MARTSQRDLRVLIMGGGIGGLALAQGLKRRGVPAEVFEANLDATPPAASYSIDLNALGNHALHACLPESLWSAYVAIAGQPLRGIRFMTERLDPLLQVAWSPAAREEDSDWRVSRNKLRQVLLTDLGDALHFGKRFVRYEALATGRVRAWFADGTEATGDVLIGADGIGSAVRKQYLPEATVEDLHVGAIGAKYPFRPNDGSDWLPGLLTDRMTIVTPPVGGGMFITQYFRTDRRSGGGKVPPELLAPDLEDHVFWALIARREAFGGSGDLRRLPPEALRASVLALVRNWDPHLRRLAAESPLPTFTAIALQSSSAMFPWKTTNVTLLGDAIHAMTPLQGLGGNTALRDAALLSETLARVQSGQIDLLPALGGYEATMRRYAGDAVRVSRRYTEQFVTDSRLGRAGFRAFLRVADKVPPLKNQLFPPTHARLGADGGNPFR